ncbi:MAG TPA: GDSL-type esterase/lipase family protein [Solirubrobacteraceae bacterium]|nr:GDSL-type esterase/lipase family protein [Solirubrobacteraceae bacterium]
MTPAASRRLGLVALGDSITVGEGSMALGITPLSWAQWLARALDLPFQSYAFNGATASDVLREQLPRVRADYDVAALYVGVNDVRDPGFDAAAYERDLAAIATRLAPRAQRLLMLTLPHDLGRPTAVPKPQVASAVVRRVAERHGAVVADLSDFGGWTNVLPDAVHPTALGQLEIADRAARALGASQLPSTLVADRRGADARYLPSHACALARDLVRRARERVRRPR